MCHFISWIEHDNKNWFLTKNELSTDRGKELIEYCGNNDDLVGHGAIRWYYNLKGGFNKECVYFTDPSRFPPEIVQALKDGLFEGMGTPYEILIKTAYKKYYIAERQAWEECSRKERQTWEECNRKERQAWDEYTKKGRLRGEEYTKITQQTYKNCHKAARQAYENYNKTTQRTFWELIKDPDNRTEVWK